MNKRCLRVLCFVFVVSGLSSMSVASSGIWEQHVYPWVSLYAKSRVQGTLGPMASIKSLDRMLDDYRTGKTLSAEDEAYNRRLKRLILYGTFDIRELSRVAMGKHWDGLSQSQRDHMVSLMVALLEEKAILSKEQGKKKSGSAQVYQLKYVSEKFVDADKSTAVVKTTVRVPSYNMSVGLSYKLRRLDGVWKIVDVIMDDSSLVENYAYMFDAIISKHGYDELIARMERKLGDMRGQPAGQG